MGVGVNVGVDEAVAVSIGLGVEVEVGVGTNVAVAVGSGVEEGVDIRSMAFDDGFLFVVPFSETTFDAEEGGC